MKKRNLIIICIIGLSIFCINIWHDIAPYFSMKYDKHLQKVTAAYGLTSTRLVNISLHDFCDDTGYFPDEYIKLHDITFKKTEIKADTIMNKKLPKKILKLADLYVPTDKGKQQMQTILYNEYNDYKASYPNMTKKDYCMLLDQNRFEIMQNKINILNELLPGFYEK